VIKRLLSHAAYGFNRVARALRWIDVYRWYAERQRSARNDEIDLAEDFRESWHQAMTGQTMPLEDVLERLNEQERDPKLIWAEKVVRELQGGELIGELVERVTGKVVIMVEYYDDEDAMTVWFEPKQAKVVNYISDTEVALLLHPVTRKVLGIRIENYVRNQDYHPEPEKDWERRVLTEDLGKYMKPDGTLDINALIDASVDWVIPDDETG
jgi:hypothetical protein